MPSKGKKQLKSTPRLEKSELPKTHSLSPVSNAEAGDDELRHILEEASNQFPSLIGKSAFIGRINNTDFESKGYKIWLSEPSMVSASLIPGSIVSISLASLEMKCLHSFPLSSIANEYRIDSDKTVYGEPGNFFFLAEVFPSSKLTKNEVRFSLGLHYGLGCPALGRVVFVHLVWKRNLTGTIDQKTGVGVPEACSFSMHDCKELYLESVPDRAQMEESTDQLSSLRSFSKRSCKELNNGNLAAEIQLGLPRARHSSLPSPKCEASTSSLTNQNMLSISSCDIAEVLKDENAYKLLQTCATSWLYSCTLLLGNHVVIPFLSDMCIFRVRGAKKLSPDVTDSILAKRKGFGKDLQAPESVKSVVDAFTVNKETRIFMQEPFHSGSVGPPGKHFSSLDTESGVTRSDRNILKLGGLSKEIAILKDIIITSSRESVLSRIGFRTAKGVLLHGPPGTGKSSLAHASAKEAGVNFFCINGPEILSPFSGESEQVLHQVFTSARKASPAVIFIDDLDAIAPAWKEGGEELTQRMVGSLLNLMDGIRNTNGVVVLAASNRPDTIEPELRRPGRLDREIEIGVPSPQQRLEILQSLLEEKNHSLSEVQVLYLARTTHGFVGADLEALCNGAAVICLKRYAERMRYSSGLLVKKTTYSKCLKEDSQFSRSPLDLVHTISDSASSCTTDSHISDAHQTAFNSNGLVSGMKNDTSESSCSSTETSIEEKLSILKVTYEDFENARLKIRPSAMREVILEVPKVCWEDVGGQNEIKNQLKEAVEWPQKYQDAFKRIGTTPPTGILMFGPPGCSKTLMARAVASEAGLNFLAVKGPELLSKWVGESEKAVRSIFVKARANAPSIIFFDEIDGLAASRGKESDGTSVSDRVMTQLLVELDGLHQRVDVTVIAATNRPDKIDPALLRPGRFDRLLYVGPPNECDREDIFRVHLRKHPCSSDVSLKELASLTDGYTGADISKICREAALAAIEESLAVTEITSQHLKAAIRQVQPTDVQSYHELSPNFQRLVLYSTGGEIEHKKLSTTGRLPLFWNLVDSVLKFLYRVGFSWLKT